MNLPEIKNLFDYTEWANRHVLDAAEALSEEDLKRDFKISHDSIFGTLAHMAGAEWVWLERWYGRSHPYLWAAHDFPDIKVMRSRWQEVEASRQAYLEQLSEEQLDKDLSYKNIKGESITLQLVTQLQHVVNHATLHRGQVVGMIRQLGVKPPAVDLLYYHITRR